MLIDKYNRLIIEKLPADIAAEVQQIKTDTEDFSDNDLVAIYEDNFNTLFKLIEKDYPEAVKPKPVLISKKVPKAQLVKKNASKGKLVRKKETKSKLVKKSTITKDDFTPVDDDCVAAKAEINAIHAKREEAAKKRANAPKKKVTIAAGEKQVKTATSIFRTSGFKSDRDKAEKFTADIVKVYRKHGLSSIADKIEKGFNGAIEKHYKS